MSRQPRNIAASVRQRLTNLARRQGEDFQLVLTRYVIERFLYRLSRSRYRDQFILKGAMLFRLWTDQPHRPTRDLDLLGKGNSTLKHLAHIIRNVCDVAVEDDGLTFDLTTVHAERIKEGEEYEGVRVRCDVRLGQARIGLQIDIGFGDAVTPGVVQLQYPTILEFPAPVLSAYPRETFIAEKFQALVSLGIANSRMKDFFDIWLLSSSFEFDGPDLAAAVQATFARRRTPLEVEPVGFSNEFAHDPSKTAQWKAFISRSRLSDAPEEFALVVQRLRDFLQPIARAVASNKAFAAHWPAGGPWQSAASEPT